MWPPPLRLFFAAALTPSNTVQVILEGKQVEGDPNHPNIIVTVSGSGPNRVELHYQTDRVVGNGKYSSLAPQPYQTGSTLLRACRVTA